MPIWVYILYLNGVAVETHRDWINWINGTLTVPHIMEIWGECSFPHYVWILENLRTEKKLVYGANATDYSANVESSNVNFTFKLEKITIYDGRWIKMERFESIEAKEVTILRVPFNDVEINTFLKNWRDLKEAPNLKKLILYFNREPNPMVVLEGIDVTDEEQMKPNNALNQWSFEMANGEKCTVILFAGRGFRFFFRVGN